VKGKVKWFSVEKGYGFITGEDGTDRYFSVQDVVGAELPGNGDSVTFEHRRGNKGPRAGRVTIVAKAAPSANQRQDDRVTCEHCNRKMVPRIIMDRGSLSHSICPFCGGLHKDFSNSACFIATAVYGDPDFPQVVALRRYRDNHLKAHLIGRAFVTVYYTVSPHLAKVFVRLPFLRPPARRYLDAIVRRLTGE